VILIPAIDLRDGRAVRLRQGDFARETVYADDPLAAARDFARAGASRIHVVDLDGARSGEPANLEHLRRIAAELAIPIQYGGGLRTLDAVAAALEAGAERVVLGTAALLDERFLDDVLRRAGDRAAVAVDARAGEVSVAGWAEGTGAAAEATVERLAASGVTRLVYTAVDRDGMLAGPDREALRKVATAAGGRMRIVYSGGVGSLDDLRSLSALQLAGLEGVIAGRALYEGRFTVAEGQAALDDREALH
jgi:phosphoribosylformimino-5-aminoimidazole carboxamide ribotide isomerase